MSEYEEELLAELELDDEWADDAEEM